MFPCIQFLADPLIRNLRGENPLDLAAQYGRLETVQLLLRKQLLPLSQETNEESSPLHLASRNGHRQVVALLLEAGFDINKRVRRNGFECVIYCTGI